MSHSRPLRLGPFVMPIGKFIGSGLGADPGFAQVLLDCGVPWLQVGSDFEYMILGCRRAFDLIRGAGEPGSTQ